MKTEKASHKKFPYWILIILLCIFGLSLFIGVNDTPDSFQYLALGRYLHYGTITPLLPYNITKPSTLFGPLYALLVTPVYSQPLPMGALVIPFFQLILLAVGAWLIAASVKNFFPRPWPVFAAILYILLPFNLVYATFMMSETLSEFWLALCIYILSQWKKHPALQTWSLLLLVSSLAVLTRFANLPIFIVCTIGWFVTIMKQSVRRALIKSVSLWLPACIGLIIVASWVFFVHSLTNTWTVSLYGGRHLYNNVIMASKLLPPSDDPTLRPFTDHSIDPKTMAQPWWTIQPWFSISKLSEQEVDRIFWRVSVSAIFHQPIAYAFNVLRLAIETPATPPYIRDHLIEDFRQCRYDACLSCVREWRNNFDCWQEKLCRAPITYCPIQSAWADVLQTQMVLYPIITTILFLIALFGCIMALIRGPLFYRVIAATFITMHLFQSATEWIEGRFLIPLYPLYTIVILLGIFYLKEMIQKIIQPKRTARKKRMR